ncbi:MAG: 23S rRNA (guanosine(2251)-2'-O)-methyltransferase RlmB [Alphaproteobacteria bacterium]
MSNDQQPSDRAPPRNRVKRRNTVGRGGRPAVKNSPPVSLWLYGQHTVEAALANPRRVIHRVVATRNARLRLGTVDESIPLEETTPRRIDHLVGRDAVHQGIAAEVAPLATLTLNELARANLVVVLDQITDPHNVGAILRTALAFGAGAVVTTARHAPAETGVLAKAASGALDRLPLITVTNLARALGEIGRMGYQRVGLDSQAEIDMAGALAGARIALVLGAEGKGLRKLTRETCDTLARLPTPGPIASLNVSNAAAIALYVAHRHMGDAP